jgi:hypothetical protein
MEHHHPLAVLVIVLAAIRRRSASPIGADSREQLPDSAPPLGVDGPPRNRNRRHGELHASLDALCASRSREIDRASSSATSSSLMRHARTESLVPPPPRPQRSPSRPSAVVRPRRPAALDDCVARRPGRLARPPRSSSLPRS